MINKLKKIIVVSTKPPEILYQLLNEEKDEFISMRNILKYLRGVVI